MSFVSLLAWVIPRHSRAQALVETALVLPLLVMLGFGAVGAAKLTQVHLGVDAIAREAARAAALAPIPVNVNSSAKREAKRLGEQQGHQVADEFGLSSADVNVNADDFDAGGWIVTDVTYEVHFTIPIMKDVFGRGVTIHSRHAERVDEFRSRAL